MENEERDEFGQGYATGYRNGFWTGSLSAFILTVALLYIVGTFL